MAKDTNRVHSHKACDSVITALKGKVALIERGEEARPTAKPAYELKQEQLAPWQSDCIGTRTGQTGELLLFNGTESDQRAKSGGDSGDYYQ